MNNLKKLFVENVSASDNRLFTYFVRYEIRPELTTIVCRFIQWSTAPKNKIKTEFSSIYNLSDYEENALRSIKTDTLRLHVMKPGQADKNILHCLYMYLLEHNEEHLNILERM